MSVLPFPTVANIRDLYDYDPIYDFLGEGNFAAVYKAKRKPRTQTFSQTNVLSGFAHPDTQPVDVALKVMSKKKLDMEKAWKDVIHEVEILRRANHENLINVFEVFQTEHDVYIVLELVSGGELFQYIQNQGSLIESDAASISFQLLRALRYLHVERRVVHRDLKPENVLISRLDSGKLVVKVVDFGLAKYFGSSQKRLLVHKFMKQNPGQPIPALPSIESVDSMGSHTDSPVVTTPCGSMRYCAPETLRHTVESGGEPRNTTRGGLQRMDIYSVGVIVYIMLCGAFPFSAKNKGLLAAQIEEGPKFVSPKWNNVSQAAKDFVSRVLCPDPKLRPSAEEALKHPWVLGAAPANPLIFSPRADFWDPATANRTDLNQGFGAIVDATEEDGKERKMARMDTPPPSLSLPPTYSPMSKFRESTPFD